MASARAEALASRLPPLLVAAERVASTVAQGVHGRRRVGQGDSFWQFRPLEVGEAASRIDWRRSARSGRGADARYFVRQTEWEAAQTVGVWCAGGPGMAWRSTPRLPTKAARAGLLMLALASLLLRGGERVRLLDGAGPSASGRAGLLRLASLMGGEAGDALPPAGTLPRHAGIALVGDWLMPLAAIRARIAGFAGRQNRGHLLQVLDPAERALPYAGRIRFNGPDGIGSALLGRAEDVRAAYATRLAAQQAGLAEICQAAGMSFSIHHTDQPPLGALLALYAAMAPPRSWS